jgi:hypothetical protein
VSDNKTKATAIGQDEKWAEFFSCEECGCVDIQEHFMFCPECGREIVFPVEDMQRRESPLLHYETETET